MKSMRMSRGCKFAPPLLALCLIGCDIWKQPTPEAKTSNEQVQAKAATSPPIKINSLLSLLGEHATNPLAFQDKYYGRTVEMEAVKLLGAGRIRRELCIQVQLVGDTSRYYEVTCYFDDSWHDFIAKLDLRQETLAHHLKITGTFNYYSGYKPNIVGIQADFVNCKVK